MRTSLVTHGLATSRLSRLLVDDYIMEPVRDWMQATHPQLAYLSSCRACASVWAAAATMILPRRVVQLLAASEVAIVVLRWEMLARATDDITTELDDMFSGEDDDG